MRIHRPPAWLVWAAIGVTILTDAACVVHLHVIFVIS